MFIEEIELVGYERLKLNQFNRIHLKFTKKLQAILGTNGSGKSSLLAELSPLPAESKNFSKNGKKVVRIRHRNKIYILTSSFNPQRHSFVIEGELDDLNPGGTITVQKDLVKKHFGITPSTHALATGRHEFHAMSTNDRKDWFRVLSDENFEYALQVFNRVKDAFRDTTGGLKLAKNKLVSFSSKLMPESDLKALREECEELYKVVEFMIENRNSPTAPLDHTKHEIKATLKDLENQSTNVIKTIIELNNLISHPLVKNEIKDIKNAGSLSFFITNRLSDIKIKKNELFVEHKKCQDILDLFSRTKFFKVASISTELETLKKAKEKLISSLVYNFNTHSPQENLEALESLTPHLLNLAIEIPVNTGSSKYTRQIYLDCTSLKETLTREVNVLKANVSNYDESIKHHSEHQKSPSVTCPKCKHHWNPHFNEDLIKDLRSKITTATEDIRYKEKLIKDQDEIMTSYNNWLSHVEAIKDLSVQYGFLNDFWSLVMKKEVLFENPRHIPQLISLYKTDLLNEKTLHEIEEKISEELEKLDMVEHSQGVDFAQATVTIKRISLELDSLANEELRLNSIKDVAQKIVSNMKKLQDVETTLKSKEQSVYTLTDQYVEDLRRIMFNDILRSFQSELAIKEKAINDEKQQENILISLQNEIKELEAQSEAYKAILRELSPTTGIIAEGLFGYMKLFIKKMNKFIATVWSYPLIVLPCATEEGKLELNYKFPLIVKSFDAKRDDIVEGSSSMREIIDLGFVISALKSIGLSESSLFLDEFGSAMDPVHKSQTSKMIADIMDNEKFAQIFIISHDVVQYSSLDNTEVCIINDANVIIPNGCIYNRHVTFE